MEESKETNVSVEKSQDKEQEKTTKKTKLTKPTIVSLVLLALLLLTGVATAAYTQIVLNDPDRIWQDAVQNTRSGLDEVNTILSTSDVSGGSISGSLNVKSPLVATATLRGDWSQDEAQITGDTKIAGVTLSSDIRVISNEDKKSDTFIKIEGLDNLSLFSELLVPGSNPFLNQANNNWYKLQSSDLDDVSGVPELLNPEKLTENEYRQEIDRFTSLLEQYIYPEDNSQNAIKYEPVGREDFNGNDSYKYRISINEGRSQELLNEIRVLLDESSVATLGVAEELEESLDIEELLNEIRNDKLELYVWVDMDLRYFRNARIYIPQDVELNSSYVDIGLDYEGGEEMPFYVNTVLVSEEENSTVNLLLSATLNKASIALNLDFMLNISTDQQPVDASGRISFIPGETSIEVEAPDDYKTIDSLIESFSQLNLSNADSFIGQDQETEIILDDVEL